MYERSFHLQEFFDRTALMKTRVFATWDCCDSYGYLPSSLDHLLEIRSRAYVSPVMMYLPVSPVAPPKMTTFDFETAHKSKVRHSKWLLTLSDSVAEAGQGNFAVDFYLLGHSSFLLLNNF